MLKHIRGMLDDTNNVRKQNLDYGTKKKKEKEKKLCTMKTYE